MNLVINLVISAVVLVFSGQVIAAEKLAVLTADKQVISEESSYALAQESSQATSNARVVKKYKTKGRTSATNQYPTSDQHTNQGRKHGSGQGQSLAKTTLAEKTNTNGNSEGSAKQIKPLLTLVAIDQKPPPSVSPAGQWLNKGFTWIDDWFIDKEVKPWQKAKLAEPVMLPGGVAPVMKKFSSKIYISKAATLGGDGVAGGGCGCK
ncbi:DUF4266 domain-containing protein [Colwellia psychrerythraea]|uniref:DUF4266 domain-containing protein n=1 Tax=Colwellia psychrerythraea TaxID=28229 RepID=A0A099KMQ1_COLPS|nr:DUF4266 domain-containing protein [Colwellia psychrerythraea]KGJ91182.1 protein of unknown function DUF4266 [Colwellia psychrerythraea]